jgi:mannitol/fructose-specific phosphotransferase system IIA component (Ntr-type)
MASIAFMSEGEFQPNGPVGRVSSPHNMGRRLRAVRSHATAIDSGLITAHSHFEPCHHPGRESLFLIPTPMATRLSSLLVPERIILSLQSTKRTAALQEVAKLLEADPNVANFTGFYNELLARERLDTTCLGNEVALPHARTEHVKKIVLAVGRSTHGVLFENCNQTVKLMFVLGTPKNNPTDYLILVGALCRLIKDESSRNALLGASTPEAFIATVVELETKLLGPAK